MTNKKSNAGRPPKVRDYDSGSRQWIANLDLLKDVDSKLKADQRYSDRSELINFLLQTWYDDQLKTFRGLAPVFNQYPELMDRFSSDPVLAKILSAAFDDTKYTVDALVDALVEYSKNVRP